jgi:hypothetical protein
MQLFIDGEIDALLAAEYEPQEIRDRKVGHTIVSNAVDRPGDIASRETSGCGQRSARWPPSESGRSASVVKVNALDTQD